MSAGSITARHYSTAHPVQVSWEGGRITEMVSAAGVPEPELWIAPPLLDLQVNGYAGIDFQRDDLTLEDLLRAVQGLRAAGCSQFLLTLITDSWDKMIARLRHLRNWRARSPQLADAIAGWHLEGPFLSPEPGFRGAHRPDVMLNPTKGHIRELRQAAEADPVLLTLAPERAGALEAIALAVSLGMKVSLGHTNASAEILRQAIRAGATGFTHFGNACPQQLDRHDNILWRALDTPGLTFSLIPDQIHVSPALFRLVHRATSGSFVYYTTDAMAAAGAPPGCYTIGHLTVQVGPDQVVREPGKTNYAGSALRPVRGVFSAAQMLASPWQKAWDAFSVSPARFMGWTRRLAPGLPADFCLLKLSSGNTVESLRMFTAGEER